MASSAMRSATMTHRLRARRLRPARVPPSPPPSPSSARQLSPSRRGAHAFPADFRHPAAAAAAAEPKNDTATPGPCGGGGGRGSRARTRQAQRQCKKARVVMRDSASCTLSAPRLTEERGCWDDRTLITRAKEAAPPHQGPSARATRRPLPSSLVARRRCCRMMPNRRREVPLAKPIGARPAGRKPSAGALRARDASACILLPVC